MSDNLDRLLALLRAEADLIDKIRGSSPFRYKSIQRLVIENGKPFLKRVDSTPFKGKPKSCFENCFKVLWNYPQLRYCEGFAIDDDLTIAISHAWLVNDTFEVIDPTWTGKRFSGCTYFGVVFNNDFVVDFVTQTKHYGILDSDYLNGYQLLREGFPAHALR